MMLDMFMGPNWSFRALTLHLLAIDVNAVRTRVLLQSFPLSKTPCIILKPKPFNMYFGIKEYHIQLKELKFILVFINVAHAH